MKRKKPTNKKHEVVEKGATNLVAISAIIALVVLHIFQDDVPPLVDYGLIGAALGAKSEDIMSWLKRK